MRPILGVRARGNGLQQNEYRCQRCGIINTFNESRTRPTWCFDCVVMLRHVA